MSKLDWLKGKEQCDLLCTKCDDECVGIKGHSGVHRCDMHRERRMEYHTLDRRILAVAVEGYNKDWSCYIGVVKGDNHEQEKYDASSHGSKLSERLARTLFPNEPWNLLVYRG